MLGALRTDTASADAGLPAAASALVTARSSMAMIQIVVKVVGGVNVPWRGQYRG